jgi:hypothetical protein
MPAAVDGRRCSLMTISGETGGERMFRPPPEYSDAPAGEKLDQPDDQRDDQQEVDEAAGNMQAEAEQPENEQNADDGPKHGGSSRVDGEARSTTAALLRSGSGTTVP